jgi:hypothetical protein
MGHDYACHWAGKRDTVTDRRRRFDREADADSDSDDAE